MELCMTCESRFVINEVLGECTDCWNDRKIRNRLEQAEWDKESIKLLYEENQILKGKLDDVAKWIKETLDGKP